MKFPNDVMKIRNWLLLGLLAGMISPSGNIHAVGLVGTEHDFSNQPWTNGELCIICHTPHHADLTVPGSLLWNHALTSQIFTPYTSPTLHSQPGQPSGLSKLCLSCHDGTIGIDTFGDNVGGRRFMSPSKRIGPDLSSEHPISMVYDSSLSASTKGLKDPSVTPSGLGGTIEDDLLFNGRMECSSCHDVHNTLGYRHLLKLSNFKSGLCLTCHDK